MNIEEKFELLKEEIRKAGELAREYFDSDDFSSVQKEDGSSVTAIDEQIEKILRAFVAKHFSEDAIIGEEQADTSGTSGYVWHIDPIDGTDNFLRKVPFCAISVARLGDSCEDSFGIVYNPITNHMFSSFCDNKMCENERISMMSPEPLGGRTAIAVCRGREPWMLTAAPKLMAACANEFGKSAMYGSAALEWAYLAAGRIDGLITFGQHSYDYAAGLFLVRAAGGMISVFEDGVWSVYEGSLKELCAEHGKTMFASHPDVHLTLRDFVGNPRRWADE